MVNKFDQVSCIHCHNNVCTRRVPIFSTLTPEEIERVVNLIVRKKFLKGETIVREGSKPESLIIINNGKAKAFKNTSEGKEQILYVFSTGDFFGEKHLLTDHRASYNVEALEETTVCMIPKSGFQTLLSEKPGIGLKIMQELVARIERLENAVENMGTKSVENRISSVLLEFAEKYGRPHSKGTLVELPLSREGIASYIGVARETVSRKMTLLQDEGIIEMVGNKKVIIIDIDELREEI